MQQFERMGVGKNVDEEREGKMEGRRITDHYGVVGNFGLEGWGLKCQDGV